jgi:ubiquinone/menaquinone biosynthesis C-methylase UbiE
VLEAGCGSGQWMHFLKRHKIEAIGLDWSEKLKKISERYDSEVRFDNGDLRKMPYSREFFGSILSVGSIEHDIEGPSTILHEMHRVLKNDGVAIITVPYNSFFRKCTFNIKDRIKNISIFRKILKKAPINRKLLNEIYQKRYKKNVYMEIKTGGGELNFFEYQFTKRQFREELECAGFQIVSLHCTELECGLYHNLRSIVGSRDNNDGEIFFNFFGKILLKILSTDISGHMICAVVRKGQKNVEN